MKQVCRVKGNPLPTVLWYKDGVRIQPSKKTRIHTKKRRSTLVIPKLRSEDAGLYECQAKSVTGDVASMSARVTVIFDIWRENTTTLWPLYGVPCPLDVYCLNGGTCYYYETVGELVCQCADGYKGQRCENKDVFNRGKRRRKCSSSSNVEYRVRHPGGLCAPRSAAPLVDVRHTTAWKAVQRPLRDTWRRELRWLS